MNILYLNPSGQLGGAEVCLLDILASMRAAEPSWQLYLITPEDGPVVSQAKALDVITTIVPFPPALSRLGDAGAGGPAGNQLSRFKLFWSLVRVIPAIFFYNRRLRIAIKTLKPEVIHTNGFKMHILGVWARPRAVPVMWHIHDYVSARPVMACLLRLYAARCSVAIANSKSVAEDVRTVCKDRFAVETIYNGVNLKRFTPTGSMLDLDALSGLPPAPPQTVRVGMLATLARWKGHETFLRAMALIPATLPIRGYIVGGALYQTNGSQHSLEELRTLIAKLGLAHRIGLTGFIDQPDAAMRALDVVVHASTQPEPFGLVIAEGMACGRAVIASNAGGAAELITVEADALGFPPGNAESLADCISRLVTDSNLRNKLGQAGRKTAVRRFDRARLARKLIPLYRSVAARNN